MVLFVTFGILNILNNATSFEALPQRYWPAPIQDYLDARHPLWIASVVPQQTQVWQDYPQLKVDHFGANSVNWTLHGYGN